MLQLELIARLRALCRADERVAAALMYGSFTRGEGDAFSDIECALFFVDGALPALDRGSWVGQIAPVALFFVDDNGHHTAIFESLVRGEFHFKPASEIASVAAWQGNAWFAAADDAVLVDRTGALREALGPLIGPAPARDTPANVAALRSNFLNWMLFGSNLLGRGELARALEILGIVHRYLQWMARLAEGATAHWPTPSKSWEQDLSAEAAGRLRRCTAELEPTALRAAYGEAWSWGRELLGLLAERHGQALPTALLERIAARIG